MKLDLNAIAKDNNISDRYVRCCNCKHGRDYGNCKVWCDFWDSKTNKDSFCSFYLKKEAL